MKTILALILSMTLTSCLACSHPTPQVSIIRPIVDQIDRAKLSIVKVQFPAEVVSHVCAGTVVDSAKGVVLTAGHCVVDGLDSYVDGNKVEVIKREGDLAALRIPAMTKPPMSIKESDPVIGEDVISFGYGYDIWTAMVRHVAAVDEPLFAVDGPLAPGMSGGPVVDQFGRLMGVNQATMSALGIATGPSRIKKFLKSVI